MRSLLHSDTPRRRSRPALVLLAAAGLVATVLVPTAAVSAAKATGASCAGVTNRPSRVGHFGGIVGIKATARAKNCGARVPAATEAPYGGTPPLLFHGGDVMATPADGSNVVVTPIYWTPPGYSFDASYESVINTYLTNLAADSGSYGNVFSALGQYTGVNGNPPASYSISTGTPIYDTDSLPATTGCTVDGGAVYSDNSGYSACVADADVTNEIDSVVQANSLPRGLGAMYLLFTPKAIESCFGHNDQCTINNSPDAAYCAYHSPFSLNGHANTIYGMMPFPIYNSPVGYTCGSDAGANFNGVIQSPNNQPDADVEISPTSHEMNEAFSDPNLDAWYDANGNENGDDCAYIYGAFGGDATTGTAYNQTVNGQHYLTQEEFSNKDFVPNTSGCVQSEPAPLLAPSVTGVAPHNGKVAGGQSVVITGSNFTGASAVDFGSVAATSFTVDSDSQITAVTPAHASGATDVTVTTPGGTSPTGTADVFKFYNPPVITKLNPTSGPRAGGQTLVIKGHQFTSGSKVRFGYTSMPASAITVVDSNTIQVTTPAHAPGVVNVYVTTPGGTSATVTADRYKFV